MDIDNNSQTDLDVQMETPDASETDPAQGADSSRLEQTIQADPVKPESPEKPEAPSGTTTLPDDHDGTDVPEEERKTEDEAPPTYEETPTVTPPNGACRGKHQQLRSGLCTRLRLCGKQR